MDNVHTRGHNCSATTFDFNPLNPGATSGRVPLNEAFFYSLSLDTGLRRLKKNKPPGLRLGYLPSPFNETKTKWQRGQNSLQAKVINAVNDAFAMHKMPSILSVRSYNLKDEAARNVALLRHLRNASANLSQVSCLDLSKVEVHKLHPGIQNVLIQRILQAPTILLSEETFNCLGNANQQKLSGRVQVVLKKKN